MKQLLCLLLCCMLLVLPACAEEASVNSWSQINQAVSKGADWQQADTDGSFHLGEKKPLAGYENLYIGDWGTYPSMDGSTVCVPMAMELARQWLGLEEGDMNGFVNFSTTPYAYDRLTQGKSNPLATIKSQGVMMDDTHPIDLVLATYPNADERQAAADAGVELVYVPIGLEAFVFFVNENNPVDTLSVEQIRDIYAGEYTNWSEVGGANRVINPVTRLSGSGSQSVMDAFMGERSIARKSPFSIAGGAIGFSFRYYMDGIVGNQAVKMLALNGIYPSAENIQNGSYPIISEFYAIYRADNTNENIPVLIDWILSEEGQTIIEQSGYVRIQ